MTVSNRVLAASSNEELDMTASTTAAARQGADPARDIPASVGAQERVVTSSGVRKVLGALRYPLGFIYLWAFLDKTFGLTFSTPSERAWIRGGTPAQGFLKGVEGPFAGIFHAIASPFADWLFQIGMLGIGLAVILGIGVRVAAVSGTLLMFFMWLAEFPPALSGSGTNPLVDYHVIYAFGLILVAITYAGDTWGLGKWWRSLPLVQGQTWLR